MYNQPMLVAEHREMARHFLEESEREFVAGQVLQSLEKMWGATCHAVIAAAMLRDLPHESHGAMRYAVRQLAVESRDNGFLNSSFTVAGVFHVNFYHGLYSGFQEPEALESARESVRILIGRLLVFSEDASLPPSNGAGPS